MAFKVSEAAVEWYKEEMDLAAGDYVQYYFQIYGGIPTSLPNYSLGMSLGASDQIGEKHEKDGITFYFTEENSWIFKEYDLEVTVKKDDLEFIFTSK